jgi:hypothetical protein
LAISPQHLLDQASMLTEPQAGHPTTETDLRRAISAAYYAVFHAIASAAADSIVPANKRATEQYSRVYRSINHGALRKLCDRVRGKKLDFGDDIREFAAAVADLQEKRHSADYDPVFTAIRSDTRLTIRAARSAISQFEGAPEAERAHFLSLLLFPPR